MNEEEIEAIEKVKDAIRVDKERRIVTLYDEKPLFRDQLQIIIDLINKQQKEIEKLNFENHMLKKWNEQLDKNCISKDKIRKRIEEARKIRWHTPKLVIEYLEELLEEN